MKKIIYAGSLVLLVLVGLGLFVQTHHVVQLAPLNQKNQRGHDSRAFYELAKTLRGAMQVNPEELRQQLVPLLQSIQRDNIARAIPPLEHAVNSLTNPNPAELYQDIMTAWYFSSPEQALGFLFQITSEGINRIQTKQATSQEAQVTYVDYQLLLGFLGVIIKVDEKNVLSHVLNDLSARITWFTNASRRDLDYFTITLDLEWLQAVLLVRTKTFAAILKNIDFEVTLQRKTMALAHFSAEKDYDSTIQSLNLMQGQLAQQVLKGLLEIQPQGLNIRIAEKLLQNVVMQVIEQKRDPQTMSIMLKNLEMASSFLHSVE